VKKIVIVKKIVHHKLHEWNCFCPCIVLITTKVIFLRNHPYSYKYIQHFGISSDTDIWMIGGRRKKTSWYWEKSIRIPKDSKRRKKKKKGPIQLLKSNMTYNNFFPGKPRVKISTVGQKSRNNSV
jgi:hypothetical protein